MKQGLLLFFAICAFANAMVPRDRRAVNTDEEEEMLRSRAPAVTSTDKAEKQVCAPQTPCAWSIYTPSLKFIEINITNSYCDCSPGTVCRVVEDDSALTAYVHRCRPPVEEEESES